MATAGSGFRGGFFGCLGVLAAIIALIVILASIGRCAQSVATNTASATPGATNSSAGALANNWVYVSATDAMQTKPTQKACVTSGNEVHQTFPYSDATGELCVRNWPGHGLDSYVELNGNGQVLCGIESCTIHIRFDDGSVQSFPAVGAADNSTNIVFIRRSAALVSALKRAAKTTVELTLYDNGVQSLAFDTHGLVWPPKP